MLGFVGKGLASLSLSLRQSITAFCDIETAVGDHLVTKRGCLCDLGSDARALPHDDACGCRTDLGDPPDGTLYVVRGAGACHPGLVHL